MKFDNGKPRYELMDYSFVEGIVKILTFGAKKYKAHSWHTVPDGRERYFAAMMRHIVAWREGEKYDKETNLHHLYHASCCAMFLIWYDKEDKKK